MMGKCTLIMGQPITMGLRCPSENTVKTLNSLFLIACYGLEGAKRLDANTKHVHLIDVKKQIKWQSWQARQTPTS